MYKRYKNFIIGDALAEAKTIFDTAKLELMFNIITIYFIIYIIGSIPIVLGVYWIIIIVQIIGVSFIIAMAIALRVTKKINLPRKIWFVSGIFFTLSTALLNFGQASFITYAFSMVNVVISFVMLGRFLRNIAIYYYSIFLTISLSITFNFLPKIILPIDLTREHQFFDQPNINAVLIALSMIIFVLVSFIRSHKIAAKQVLEQKVQVVSQKELIKKKNETLRHSIDLAATLQKEIIIDWKSVNKFFYNNYYLRFPKQKLAGEFFWIKPYNNSVFFTLVDAGEMGIPGAMLSFIFRNGLEKAIQDVDAPTPKSIMTFIYNFVTASLKDKDALNSSIKISLGQYDKPTNTLSYVGVSLPILIQKEKQVKTLFPKYRKFNFSDTAIEIDEIRMKLDPRDTIFLFSDGISDANSITNGLPTDYTDFESLIYLNRASLFEEVTNKISKKYETLKTNNQQKDDITIVALNVK